MSPKELLYIDDALGHETHLKGACTNFASQIEDPKLKTFVQQLATRHGKSFDKIFKLLNS